MFKKSSVTMERVYVPFPYVSAVFNKDDNDEVGGIKKKWEYNLHCECTRLREVRKSYRLPLPLAS